MIVYRDEAGHFASYESYANDTDGRISAHDVHYAWEDRQSEREGELKELDGGGDVPDFSDDGDAYDYESFDYDVGESEY